jgi:hypothetical protein
MGEEADDAGAKEMQEWMAYMTPGAQHKKLAAQAGEWTVATKFWMAGPDAPPAESAGTAKMKMILGGRFQMQEFSGTMMGMPFEGVGLIGFDNATKELTSVWVDGMGTGTMIAKGKPAAEKAPQSFTGEMVAPDGSTYATRTVITEKGADEFVFEMFMKGGESPDEAKAMELTYKRKK